MLKINNLHAEILGGEKILNGINLNINSGEVHALMGPNGSGKSTLANVIAGRDTYNVSDGEIIFQNDDISEFLPDERSRKGIFMAFQYPAEIPGVRPWQFLKAAVDAKRLTEGQKEMSVREFSSFFDEKAKEVGINSNLLKRSLNEGFSGGEKKRNEMLQMLVLQPKLCVMDETDSGLDVDALKTVAQAVNGLTDSNRSFLIVTHYQRLLDYIKPDFVHILVNGKIVNSGDYELALEIEKSGYETYL
ncbi:MAG: Fe-S cluster assembly ATPase SufC [Dehalococcoidia bacterium]|nr:Fe-S cluster assembly ATPase SufC [Dehalococcoidia bacterium]|tara:strand:- start:411 stop:1151 length:741 start_codon:yes stop_codon:yes gene_type:complete